MQLLSGALKVGLRRESGRERNFTRFKYLYEWGGMGLKIWKVTDSFYDGNDCRPCKL